MTGGCGGRGEQVIRSVRLLLADTGTGGTVTSAMLEEAASMDWLLSAATKERSNKI